MVNESQHVPRGPISVRFATIGTFVLGVILLFLGICLALNRAVQQQWRSNVDSTASITIDLGSQLPGQILQRRVVIRNTGSQTMHFTQIMTSCGCLQSTLQPQTIRAGAASILTLQIATRPWTGPELVTVTLMGTMKAAPLVRRYLVRYTVRRLIRICGTQDNSGEPYYLDIGTLSVGAKPKPFQVSITRGTYPPHWDTLRCSTSDPRLAAKVRPIGRDSWMLSLIPRGLTILGSQSYQLRFSFYRGGKELPYHYSQPVNFMVRGPVSIEPDSIFFGAVPYDSTVIKHLQLVTSATGQIGKGRILSATSTDPCHAVVAVTGGGKGLRATFHAAGTQGRSTGRFLVTARYGDSQYQFRVDYLVYVLGKGGKK